MSLALIRFAFLCTLLSVSYPALAEEKGAAAGAITGGIAGAIDAINGAGVPANARTLAGAIAETPPPSSSLTAQASASAVIRPRWVVFDFAIWIKTIELADGSFHEELFEAEPVAQLALSTLPHARALIDPGSREACRRRASFCVAAYLRPALGNQSYCPEPGGPGRSVAVERSCSFPIGAGA